MRPTSRNSRRLLILLILAFLSARCTTPGGETASEASPRGDGPSLVLLLVIDQARYDYLERFDELYEGGLRYLLDNGAVFTDAHHNHAITSTAPGHATIATGMDPARSGIVSNNWYDPVTREEVYSARGPDGVESPYYLEVTALGDWMKSADPRSRVFSASPKDRSAVMMGGQNADAAYWYDRDLGVWESSEYYADAERAWLPAFHRQKLLDEYFGTTWGPLVSADRWAELGVESLDRGEFSWGFPYVLGGYTPVAGESFYRAVYSTPYMDWYLVQFAKALIANEQLGADGSVDLLALGFSALDSVGHTYGPDSPEVLDALVRIDLYLQELLNFIDREVGLEHVVIGLSADHGVVPLPEFRARDGAEGRRLGVDDALCVQNAGRQLSRKLGVDDWLLSGFYLNEETIARHGLQKAAVEQELAELMRECPAVQRVWTASELQTAWPDASDETFVRYSNNYFPGRSPDLYIQFHPYDLYLPGTGTTHGSVHEYDSHVPIILAGPGIGSGVIGDRVNTADIAPTLAGILGVESPAGLDGVDRAELLPPPRWDR